MEPVSRTCRLEDFDWSASVTLDRRLLHAVFSLEFSSTSTCCWWDPLAFGKSFLAQALGYSGSGWTHRALQDDFFRAMAQARVDNSVDRAFRSPDARFASWMTWVSTGSPPSSPDLYELILNRHRSSRCSITSNRAVEEWLSLSVIPSSATGPGPPGQGQLPDRHRGHQLPGSGCPHTAPCSTTKEVDRPTTT